jgi:hypothetical protein
MIISDIISALALPPESFVEKRVPKKLLVEHGTPTASDKRQVQDNVDELYWHAVLKPTNVGIPEHRDDVREILEVAVLSIALRSPAKPARLLELVHRAIPYPMLLVAAQEGMFTLSLAQKRFSQNEAGRVVIEGGVVACPLIDHPARPALLTSLALAAQPRTNLWAFYLGWMACFEAFQAAQLTGTFSVSANFQTTVDRREALATHERLEHEIALLRAQANRETQLHHRVELNLTLQRLEAERAEAIAKL